MVGMPEWMQRTRDAKGEDRLNERDGIKKGIGLVRGKKAGSPADVDTYEIMTLKEVADYLRCHTSTVYRLIHTRQIPTFRLGADFRFRKTDIKKWIANGGGQV